MTPSNAATVASIYRYPVKGLSPERLHTVDLEAGETLPFDRAFAIEAGVRVFDPAAPRPLPKTAFIMLMRHERVARLETRFDSETHLLTIRRDGTTLAEGRLDDPDGRVVVEQFFAAFMVGEIQGPPRIVSSPHHSFTDRAEKCVSIINLATIDDIERISGRTVDPMRFRANIYIDGIEPWAEFGWVGADIEVGEIQLKGFARTPRCAATNVDPATGDRDMQIPRLLSQVFGHRDCGIYATVERGGCLTEGLNLTPIGEAGQSRPDSD